MAGAGLKKYKPTSIPLEQEGVKKNVIFPRTFICLTGLTGYGKLRGYARNVIAGHRL